MSNHEEQFEYEGRLVFNGLFQTDVGNVDYSGILEQLPTYHQGSPTDPGHGFAKIDLEDWIGVDSLLEPELEALADETIAFRYIVEEYHEEEFVDIEGNTEVAYSRSTNTVDVYWLFPDFLFLRGTKNNVQEVKNYLRQLSHEIQLNKMEFEPDFLIWIFYKYYSNQNLRDRFRVHRLTDAKITGEHDVFGKKRRISDSTDLIKSPSVLTAILRGEDLMTLGSHFSSGSFDKVSADISAGGRIHVKAQSGSIQDSRPLRRILISLRFIENLSSTYIQWENLEPRDKYPPVIFFEELYGELDELGISVDFALDRVIDEYNAKRGEQ